MAYQHKDPQNELTHLANGRSVCTIQHTLLGLMACSVEKWRLGRVLSGKAAPRPGSRAESPNNLPVFISNKRVVEIISVLGCGQKALPKGSSERNCALGGSFLLPIANMLSIQCLGRWKQALLNTVLVAQQPWHGQGTCKLPQSEDILDPSLRPQQDSSLAGASGNIEEQKEGQRASAHGGMILMILYFITLDGNAVVPSPPVCACRRTVDMG